MPKKRANKNRRIFQPPSETKQSQIILDTLLIPQKYIVDL